MILFIIYQALIHLLFVLLIPFLLYCFIFSKSNRVFLFILGRVFQKYPFQKTNNILFHASSGEFESLFPIIRNLKTENYVCSLFSDSYKSKVSSKINNSSEINKVFFSPIDSIIFVLIFFKRLKIKKIIISQKDFWPAFFYGAQFLKIPIEVIDFYLKEMPRGLLKFYYKYFLNRSNAVVVHDELTQQYLEKLNITAKIIKADDHRLLQIGHRLNVSQDKYEFIKDVIIFGSTWPEDEVEIALALENIDLDTKQIVIVPHDFKHFDGTRFNKFNPQLWSQIKEGQVIGDSLIVVDKFGILLNLYKSADLSFVGGSFRKKVHNVLEPLFLGNKVMVGPNNNNSLAVRLYSSNILHVNGHADISSVINNFKFSNQETSQRAHFFKNLYLNSSVYNI